LITALSLEYLAFPPLRGGLFFSLERCDLKEEKRFYQLIIIPSSNESDPLFVPPLSGEWM